MKMLWKVSFYSDYAKIALENFTTIEGLLGKRKVIDDKFEKTRHVTEDEDSIFGELNSEIDKRTRVVIIFCALAVEAFINDYAIDHLSRSYFDNHLDKLDLLSKWVLIPRIVTGSQLEKGNKPIQDLDWLIKHRNKLVHFKSQFVEVDNLKFYNKEEAEKAINTVRNIALALHEIDATAHETWLYYKKNWFPSKRLS